MFNHIEGTIKLTGDIPIAPVHFLQNFYQRYEKAMLGWATLLCLLALWELAPVLGWINPLFTSSPSRILQAAQWLLAHGFWNDIRVSSIEFVYGFGLALLVGTPLGILLVDPGVNKVPYFYHDVHE